jgi:hypothetical protein
VNKYYEVAVFTASHHWYANVIIDFIDPKGIYFQHRFYRESCIKTTDNVYVKDLRIFKGVDLKNIMLVDNAVYSFGVQLGNGIPITPFKEDKNDREFRFLKRFLLDIRNCEDLREPIRAAFQLEDLFSADYEFEEFIEYYDYEECEIEQDQDDEHELEQERLRSAAPPSKNKGESS